MTESTDFTLQKLFNKENKLDGYSLYFDGTIECEGELLKNRVIVDYDLEGTILFYYTECNQDEDINEAPVYNDVFIPKDRVKLIASCMLHASELMNELLEEKNDLNRIHEKIKRIANGK